MLEFDKASLSYRLSSLSARKRLAFMLLLCERMMPGFQKFGADTGFDLSIHHECLEKGWAYLGGNPNPESYEELAERCLESTPDTEDYQHILTSAALDTALSVRNLMLFLSDHNTYPIVESAGFACDTMFMWVEKRTPVPAQSVHEAMEMVLRDPLVQQELSRQAEDIEFVASLPEDFDSETILQVK
jgi:uncharacterized protein YjaG (DUF416 family)